MAVNLNLTDKHILWTPITSQGIKLPLPIDSCCSISLVSKNHADALLQANPTLLFTPLDQPLTVSVANPQAKLYATGILPVPITWPNGQNSTFQMLVVPNLAWPILFGENHLKLTQALVDHANSRIKFLHPDLNFVIQCPASNPTQMLTPQTTSATTGSTSSPSVPGVNVTCILTGMPTPLQDHPEFLSQRLNFITVCLILTTSLIGTSLLNQQFWIEGNTLAPGVNVLNGPTYLHNAPFTVTPTFLAPKPKSTPNQPVPISPDEPPSQYASLIPQNTLSSVTSLEDISFPDVQQVYYTTLAIESTRQKELTLPFNEQLATIQPFTTHHEEIFQGAARHTAERLADTWKVYISYPHTSDNLTSSNTASTSSRTPLPQTWNPDIQNQEMIQAASDSTSLTSFREQLHIPIEHHSYFPPDMPSISPNSPG